MKKIVIMFLISFLCFPVFAQNNEDLFFSEVWAYLMEKEESFLKPSYPITDIGYFAAEINYAGKLISVPDRSKIKNFSGRVHLVVAQTNNRSLTHFVLDPSFRLRDKLIDDIVRAIRNYDGLQIDFEQVASADRINFYSFLAELKRRIGGKTLSVALGARTKYLNDAYEYEKIANIADRIIIMAYDEHWSGSAPGPVASFEWSKRVAQYSRKTISSNKLVMGMPFYARAWGDINPSKAYKYSGVQKLRTDKRVTPVEFRNSNPFFKYKETVNVTVFFENADSILKRMQLYYDANIRNIAFWRLGQEDYAVWNYIKYSK
jgi:spore germination protein YaaH